MTAFPLDVCLAELDEFKGIEHKKGFTRHFGTLFPEPAIRTLLKESLNPSHENDPLMPNTLESWIVYHNEPNEISEYEWCIIYCFSRFTDGNIRLTKIQFAG